MSKRALLFAILIGFSLGVEAHGISVDETFGHIVALAKHDPRSCAQSASQLPGSFKASDYESLFIKLRLSRLDFEDLGEEGVACLENARNRSLYQLARMPGGDRALVRLLENRSLRWDGANSLTLCDAIVRRGKSMLPVLATVTSKNKAWARRCGNLIEQGYPTAI
jgi:hypothetical protein